jgi:hypothetical protein
MSARPPALTIPPFDASSFGPTGTPRMPEHPPGWAPPPTDSQRADPRDPCHCPRHAPASVFTRNTLGFYGSSVPACSGCRRGDQDAIEDALVRTIRSQEARLRQLLCDGYPDDDVTTLIASLTADIATLEGHTTALPTATEYARRALAIAHTAVTLHAYLIAPEPSPSDFYNAYMAHKETLDRFTPETFTGTAAADRLFTG